ncbi:hypothetical protein KAR91_59990 [Candidatus Pacearchaeota archaeon]|nr:hypothetical protein [Candidatus Pacearchaeota archaeon]
MHLIPRLKQDDVQFLYDKALKQGLAENDTPETMQGFIWSNTPLEKSEPPVRPLFNALDMLDAVIGCLMTGYVIWFILIAV